MRTLGLCLSRQRAAPGFTLLELMVVLALLSGIGWSAQPTLQRWLERGRVELAREQLHNDVQSARVRAMQMGQALRLARLSDCAWASPAGGDWSCGWQLQLADGSQTLQVTALHSPLLLSFTKTTALSISRQGELGTIGERWTLASRQTHLNVSLSLCLNNSGRIRAVTGATCS